MASQTGTLKFRQSDGTYTELYPKTTIAQVDGLQTQLDNINTSLQNKVGYTFADNGIKTIQGMYFMASDSFQILKGGTIDGASLGMNVYPAEANFHWYPKNASSKESYELKLSQIGLYYGKIERTDDGTVIDHRKQIATEEYVTNAIQGAINSSY